MLLLKTYALDKLHSLTQGKALHHAYPQPKKHLRMSPLRPPGQGPQTEMVRRNLPFTVEGRRLGSHQDILGSLKTHF